MGVPTIKMEVVWSIGILVCSIETRFTLKNAGIWSP